ncbi:hypothetical protein D3C85_769250 [compost metagenome]
MARLGGRGRVLSIGGHRPLDRRAGQRSLLPLECVRRALHHRGACHLVDCVQRRGRAARAALRQGVVCASRRRLDSCRPPSRALRVVDDLRRAVPDRRGAAIPGRLCRAVRALALRNGGRHGRNRVGHLFLPTLPHELRWHGAVLPGPVPVHCGNQAAMACTACAAPGIQPGLRRQRFVRLHAGLARGAGPGMGRATRRFRTRVDRACVDPVRFRQGANTQLPRGGPLHRGGGRQRRHLHRPRGAGVARRHLHQPVPKGRNRPLARRVRQSAARYGRKRYPRCVPARLRHRIQSLVPVHHTGTHPKLRRRKARRVLERLSAKQHLQPHAPQLLKLGGAGAGRGVGRRGGAAARQPGRWARTDPAAADAGIVGGVADPQTRPHDGVDARADAGLRPRHEHAG